MANYTVNSTSKSVRADLCVSPDLRVAPTGGTAIMDAAYLPDMNWRVLTPTQAARALAQANPHISPALITVKSWTQKGKGGWGWTARHTQLVAVDGQANPLGYKRCWGGSEYPPSTSAPSALPSIYHNGWCHICGSVHATHTLAWAQAPDGWVLACPACAQINTLHLQPITSPYLIWLGPHRPVPSALAQYQRPTYDYRIWLDLTAGGAVEIAWYSAYASARARLETALGTIKTWCETHGGDVVDYLLIADHLDAGLRPTADIERDAAHAEDIAARLDDYAAPRDILAERRAQ